MELWQKVILLLFTFNTGACHISFTSFSLLFNDTRVNKHDKLLPSLTRLQCSLYCWLNNPCLSFAYAIQNQECYLYNRRLRREEMTTVHSGLVTFVPDLENLALNKSAKQSSILGSTEWASEGVDGKIGDDSKIQTHQDKPSWWCVDLSSNYDISHIVIYNRQGGYAYRIRNFELHVSPTGDCTEGNLNSSSFCYKNDGQTNRTYTITSCNQPSSLDNVRSINISLYGMNLHFEEFEVYRKVPCLKK